jgi:hypothetical protein
MGILGNLDNDFFRPVVARSKVVFDRDSFMLCINTFVETEIADAEDEMRRIRAQSWLRDNRADELTERQQQKIAVISGWKNKQLTDKRLSSILSISGLVRVWGELHPHVPFIIGRKPYIMAKTDDVILTDDDDGSKWNLGPFVIMLPLGGQVGEMHWVPVRDPKCHARHPHHGIFDGRYGRQDGGANTCLGSYQSYVANALAMGDVTSLLPLMSNYIRSYNPHSPLYYMREITHAERL